MFLLGLDTVRAIISASGIVPENDKFLSRIIYGKKRPATVKEALIELGYKPLRTEGIINEFKFIKDRLINKDDDWCYKELIRLINQCMVKFDEEIQYGEDSPVRTKYYIDTMSGIHNPEIQEKMKDIMTYLINKYYKKGIPKFIITPKNGNLLFGKVIAISYSIPVLFHKPTKNNPSRATNVTQTVPYTKSRAESEFKVNFEGSLSSDMTKKHDGILVDCNVAGGTQIIEAVEEFRKLIRLQGGINNCHPTIKHVFTLFRVNDDPGFDKRFEDAKTKFHCILMLSEDIKIKIYNQGYPLSDGEIDAIINELEQRGYLFLRQSKKNRRAKSTRNTEDNNHPQNNPDSAITTEKKGDNYES